MFLKWLRGLQINSIMEVNNLFPTTLLEFTLENANFTGCLGTDDKCDFLNDTINNDQIKHCNQK